MRAVQKLVLSQSYAQMRSLGYFTQKQLAGASNFPPQTASAEGRHTMFGYFISFLKGERHGTGQ
jgi:hypothetical protein